MHIYEEKLLLPRRAQPIIYRIPSRAAKNQIAKQKGNLS